jgi:hypothetical protein
VKAFPAREEGADSEMSRGRLRSVIRDLTGRTDRELVRLLRSQLDATLAGGRLTAGLVSGEVAPKVARARIATIEHRGDTARERVIVAMEHSVVSPIDREDLFRLSRSIDDILDTLRDFVRQVDLFQLDDPGRFAALVTPLVDELQRGLSALGEAVQQLADDPSRVARAALAAKKTGLGKRYLEAMATALAAGLTTDTYKHVELLRQLDHAGRQLVAAADALADGAIKRAH